MITNREKIFKTLKIETHNRIPISSDCCREYTAIYGKAFLGNIFI